MKVINHFISEAERTEINTWVESYNPHAVPLENNPAKSISDQLNGYTLLYDISESDISKHISKFQGDRSTDNILPPVVSGLVDRITAVASINRDHVFMQLIVLNQGGIISPHYDASINGYINYKCNVCIAGPAVDRIYIDKSHVDVSPRDLYCFEASLLKHWADAVETQRIVLSFGFMVPYEVLGWSANSPRVKLSKSIMKIFD